MSDDEPPITHGGVFTPAPKESVDPTLYNISTQLITPAPTFIENIDNFAIRHINILLIAFLFTIFIAIFMYTKTPYYTSSVSTYSYIQ
jgi:hypothetical protein